MERRIVIYTDGASRGNPGRSASGFSVRDGERFESHLHYNGTATNNYAEYNAIIMALEWCLRGAGEPKELALAIHSDSTIAVNQIKGSYKVRAEGLIPLQRRVRSLMGNFRSVSLTLVPRENPGIVEVDRSLNRLLDRMEKEGNLPGEE